MIPARVDLWIFWPSAPRFHVAYAARRASASRRPRSQPSPCGPGADHAPTLTAAVSSRVCRYDAQTFMRTMQDRLIHTADKPQQTPAEVRPNVIRAASAPRQRRAG